jgi:hypothetical protein
MEEFGMNFLEKDLEEIIFTSCRKELDKRGFHIGEKSTLLRQKKIGNYGIADLIEISKPYYHTCFKHICKGSINVIELKQDKIGISAFLQALQYLKGIKSYLEKRGLDQLFNFEITLIGKSIDTNSSYVYLSEFTNEYFENIVNDNSSFILRNYIYKYNIDGIYFNDVNIHNLKNEGF